MKLLLKLAVVGVLILVLAGAAVVFFMDGAVKKGVEHFGPILTKTPVTLDSARISLFSGAGAMDGLKVGNPEGYTSEPAIKVGHASLAVQPMSFFSDKVVVRSMRVESPEVSFEGGLRGNNLSKLMANIEQASAAMAGTGTNATPSADQPSKKLQVDELVLAGAKLHVTLTDLGNKKLSLTLPDIRLASLGQGPDGITAGELTKLIMNSILSESTKSITANLGNLSGLGKGLLDAGGSAAKGAVDAAKDLGKGAGDTLQKAGKGVTDLFKKKP